MNICNSEGENLPIGFRPIAACFMATSGVCHCVPPRFAAAVVHDAALRTLEGEHRPTSKTTPQWSKIGHDGHSRWKNAKPYGLVWKLWEPTGVHWSIVTFPLFLMAILGGVYNFRHTHTHIFCSTCSKAIWCSFGHCKQESIGEPY
jgi:hypothetical protein